MGYAALEGPPIGAFPMSLLDCLNAVKDVEIGRPEARREEEIVELPGFGPGGADHEALQVVSGLQR